MIIQGECIEALRGMPPNEFDSLVTDPPAGISFMGKDWDKDKGGRSGWVAWMTEVMRECHRVLKPGAHGLVWAIPRTSHWTATALEDAGFEIRDVVTHLFGTGFPKSLDVSKAIDKAAGAEREVIGKSARHVSGKPNQRTEGLCGTSTFQESVGMGAYVTTPSTDDAKRWQGFGTALKPACEHWILVRKPCSEKTVAANVLKWGCGALNIDGCRIGTESTRRPLGKSIAGQFAGDERKDRSSIGAIGGSESGRFPANLVLDEEAAAMLDEQVGFLHGAGNKNLGPPPIKKDSSIFGMGANGGPDVVYDRCGMASRFFYTAKASKSDRGEGNTHPTVKSTKLMSYLCRLVTPPGGTVLDPFTGSGSTGVAAKAEGFQFVGVEQDPSYCDIARNRIEGHHVL